MPSCASCDQYLAPNAVASDGSCPTCGEQVEVTTQARKEAKIPWHFWLVLIAASGYIGFRAIEGIGWLIHQV